ncbi:hypothetical protein [Rasiella sp. SM2506]|uniref:hypothetical protein n=1 Tax=Rasiella sp. SM2506 TaxID=3423914 RepID=UPI003D7BF316
MIHTINPITINKVNQVLSELQDKYPEVYNLMGEEPFGHLYGTKKKIDNQTLLNYITDIEELLQQLSVTHPS